MEEGDIKTIIYRLDKIDENMKEFKDLLVNVSLQAKKNDEQDDKIKELSRDITTMKENINKYIEGNVNKCAITENNFHKDISVIQNDIKELKGRVQEVEDRPIKENASKWRYIIDYIFKGIVGIAVGVLFIKMGLK